MFNDLLYSGTLRKDEIAILQNETFLPLGKVEGDIEVEYSFDGCVFYRGPKINQTFRYLRLSGKRATSFRIYEGHGFVCSPLLELSDVFFRRHLWSGADGIYSFNLRRKEDYNQIDDPTLFVFGDTFVGESLLNNKRLEPTKMVNNSLCYLNKGDYSFFVNRDEKGAFISAFPLEEKYTRSGYLSANLTLDLGKDVSLKPYISALGLEEETHIDFSLHGRKKIERIEIENFFDDSYALPTSYKRGAREIEILASNDEKEYSSLGLFTLSMNEDGKRVDTLKVAFETSFVRFVLKKKTGLTEEDDAIGLKKVRFYDEEGYLPDVEAEASSLSAYENIKSWFWLQDGYINGDTLTIYPEIVQEELNGIEGFEFRIAGVNEVKVKIKDDRLDLSSVTMRQVPFYALDDEVEFILGSAILDNSDLDGYLYIYGYKNDRKSSLRSLIVSRIKPSDLGDYNELRYYDGKDWVRDYKEAKLLLPHVSTEMSVIPLKKGYFEGKYLAIFQYDSIGKYVSYAVMDSPYECASPVCPLYLTPELEKYNSTTYTYNAKAHLHLSKEDDILLSYNVNDMSMKENKEDCSIYHPRFLSLKFND